MSGDQSGHLSGDRTSLTDVDRSALRPLWQAVHERLSSGRAVSRVHVGPLDDDQREALADLLGMDRLPGPGPPSRWRGWKRR